MVVAGVWPVIVADFAARHGDPPGRGARLAALGVVVGDDDLFEIEEVGDENDIDQVECEDGDVQRALPQGDDGSQDDRYCLLHCDRPPSDRQEPDSLLPLLLTRSDLSAALLELSYLLVGYRRDLPHILYDLESFFRGFEPLDRCSSPRMRRTPCHCDRFVSGFFN